jgi:hypothetical protein
VILLPLALGAVFVDLLARRPGLVALGLVLAVPIAALAGWTYLLINAQPGQSIESSIEAVIAYNFGDTPYFGHGLNRTSIYTYWFENHGLADPVRTVFGHGLGSSFGGISEPDPGHMEHAHNRVFIGLTAASSILWDLGLLGAGMYLAIFVMAAREAGRLVKTAQPGFDRAFCRALMAMAVMLTVMPFYSNAAISVPTQQVLTALTLGLIAWRRRSAPHLRAAADARRGR